MSGEITQADAKRKYNIKSNSAKSGVKALRMALKNMSDTSNTIHHSDRGIQYCSNEYTKILKKNNIKISMTENSDPLENAVAEREIHSR